MKKIQIELQCDRFSLRKLRLTDADEIFHLRSDIQLNTFIQRKPLIKLSESLDFINKIRSQISKQQCYHWALELNGQDKIMGTICLWNIDWKINQAELGYDLMAEQHKKGYMREALKAVLDFGFKEVGFHQIRAYTQQDNRASIALVKHYNFKATQAIDSTNPKNVIFALAKVDYVPE